MSDKMKCLTCGDFFNMSNLSEVLMHEHKGIWLRNNITGQLSCVSLAEKESINVKNISFNNDDDSMDVTYRNDNTYRYLDIPYDVFFKVVKSANVGKALSDYVKGFYRYYNLNGD